MRTRFSLPIAALLACAVLAPCAAAERACPGPGAAADFAPGNGAEGLEFTVLRNGKRVGRHRTRFAREDGYLVVTSDMKLDIRFLFVNAYRYRYAATEHWCNGRLVRLDSTVNANGKRSQTRARATGEQLEIDGPHGRAIAPLGLFSTNHWHSGVLEAATVLNTLTGRVNEVRLAPCAPAPVGEGPADARCYDYTGDLSARVWYDRDGRWVGLAFDGDDGSRLEYRCVNCGNRAQAL